jgi:hypothetical protein
MRAARYILACLAVLVLAPAAGAKPAQVAAPTGLHGFLLRADEPAATSFARTPAFAWNPVPGALRYQFQLATSTPSRENAILYTATAKSPVAALTTTLPWTTNIMHARVRAVLNDNVTPWSAPFNFDMAPPPPPRPLSSLGYPGLLRWTPVEGAGGYEVWLIDVPTTHKVVFTNVLDEREFYTFHRTSSWTSTVRWRIRALRYDRDPDQRRNGIPAVGYGRWSDVYSSSNPMYTGGGPTKPIGTLSDVFSAAHDDNARAHKLMPAFLFSGDQTKDGRSAELFRIYVSTDRDCLNTVFTSTVFGGPAYAPRPYAGPLNLPTTTAGIAAARAAYLPAGSEPDGYMLDGESVRATEKLTASSPTVAVPWDSDTDPGGLLAAGPTAPAQIKAGTDLGAPVDLWDTESTVSRGYWWTVVPVVAETPGLLSTNLTASSAVGATAVSVLSSAGFATGDVVTIGNGSNQETATVVSTTASTLSVAAALKFAHGPGELVQSGSGSLRYRDLELPQDVCTQPDRVARFAKNSEPALTASGELFATGLSSGGRLISARRASTFYGGPLVAWAPAMGATAYEVQWSKKAYPFKPEPNPANANAPGTLTLGTAAVLPLTPGTWYYRVRGFNYSLPTNAQQMSWSDPARISVAKPKFKLVGGGK